MKYLSTEDIGTDEVPIYCCMILVLMKYLSTADTGIDEVAIYC